MKRFAALVAGPWLAAVFATAAAAAVYRVEITDMHFGAPPDRLKAGDTIIWKNSDIVRHTVTAWNGTFDLVLDPGQSKPVTLRAAGVVLIYCRYHPDMTLRLPVARR